MSGAKRLRNEHEYHSPKDPIMNQERDLPDVLPGHWDTAEGREMAMRYADTERPAMHLGSDLALANAAFMELHEPLGSGTKERMRWLSVQLALAQAEVERLRSGGEGWRLVPVEPTEAMIEAAVDQTIQQYDDNRNWDDAKDVIEKLDQAAIYRAMLAAAPSPPTHGEG